MDADLATTTRTLSFRVDGQSFSLRTELVQEVARMPPITRVPHAPAALLGLANLRGTVISILSMAQLLRRAPGIPTRIIVIDASERLGLAVDEASQVLTTNQADSTIEIDIAELVAQNMPAQASRRLRGTGTGTVSSGERQDKTEAIALVAFAIGNQEFAMPLAAVEEVLRLPNDIALMPDADEVVIGSAAVRGAVLPLLSLRALLALPGLGESPRVRLLVVRIGSHRIGLLVDEMRSILRVSEAMIDAVPQVLSRGQAEARIQAICRLDDGERLISVLAADQLLRDDITARLLNGGSTAEHKSMVQDEGESASEQFLLFRIGEEEFGIPIAAVETVAQLPAKLTPLPKAPAFVLGVMNLRGQVIPVIDQAQRFGASASQSARRRIIVTRIGELEAGFIVDAVSEVVRVDAGALRPAPEFGNEETRVFERVANLAEEQRIILIVNPRELLDRAEQDLLRRLGKKGAKTSS
ncbi:chemotaxis protein CheW [Novosphingobium sp. G106]|uniref:chemotaxis protein CheW n=1 Tax=Novosphingobium sp. G106 TaxID=2849500 RepID=UPI0020C56B0E|nr:chemotaxis protein CheW [Novosphingobium sp. G106]